MGEWGPYLHPFRSRVPKSVFFGAASGDAKITFYRKF